MFLCRTSEFAHMQITIYVQYRGGEHRSWAHRKHQSSARNNWKAGLSDLCAIPQQLKYICIGIAGFSSPEGTPKHPGTFSLVVQMLQSVLYHFMPMPNVLHL